MLGAATTGAALAHAFHHSAAIVVTAEGAVFEGIVAPSSILATGGSLDLLKTSMLHSPSDGPRECEEQIQIPIGQISRISIRAPRIAPQAATPKAACGAPRRLRPLIVQGDVPGVSLEDLPSTRSGDAAMSEFERAAGRSSFAFDQYSVPIDRRSAEFRAHHDAVTAELRAQIRRGERVEFSELPEQLKAEVARGELPRAAVRVRGDELRAWVDENPPSSPSSASSQRLAAVEAPSNIAARRDVVRRMYGKRSRQFLSPRYRGLQIDVSLPTVKESDFSKIREKCYEVKQSQIRAERGRGAATHQPPEAPAPAVAPPSLEEFKRRLERQRELQRVRAKLDRARAACERAAAASQK